MTLNVRRFGDPSSQPIVCVAGFADHGGMFEALGPTGLGQRFSILAVDLPGTGSTPPAREPLTLQTAADLVAEIVDQHAATIVAGHSVGSIVASLAAGHPGSSIHTVLSIEGNLTAEDAYFSGSAARFDSAAVFHASFLARLDETTPDNPSLHRYRQQAAMADPRSIWELGCDTHEWSRAHHPGEILAEAADDVRYLYNPTNTPVESLRWLADSDLTTIRLDGASHWKAVDQPETMSDKLLEALAA